MRQLHIIAWDAAKNQLMAQYLFSPQLVNRRNQIPLVRLLSVKMIKGKRVS